MGIIGENGTPVEPARRSAGAYLGRGDTRSGVRGRAWPSIVATCGVPWPRVERCPCFELAWAWPCLPENYGGPGHQACPRKLGHGTRFRQSVTQ